MSGREGPGHPALFFLRRALSVLAWVVAISGATLVAQVKPAYLYSLSSFAGPLRYDWVRLQVDQKRDETYVIYQNVVRVFNPSGMEIFSFGDDLQVGQILDAAVDPAGSIILLSYRDSKSLVTRCNYRGVATGRIDITKLPPGLTFSANRVLARDGLLYFASLTAASVIITDSNGEFRNHVEFQPMLEVDEKEKAGAEMGGFTVDRDGSIYFTIPTAFKVYKYALDGKVTFFGSSGSAAGKFGVIGGVAVDSRGDILVADKLKCVVMAFDKDFRFLGEFGYRGAKPQNLILPDEIAIDSRDRLYVSQARRRGISVFALNAG